MNSREVACARVGSAVIAAFVQASLEATLPGAADAGACCGLGAPAVPAARCAVLFETLQGRTLARRGSSRRSLSPNFSAVMPHWV